MAARRIWKPALHTWPPGEQNQARVGNGNGKAELPPADLVRQGAGHFLNVFPRRDGVPAPGGVEEEEGDFRVLADKLRVVQLPQEKINDRRG